MCPSLFGTWGMRPNGRRDADASLLPLGVHRRRRDGLRRPPRPATDAAPPAHRQPRSPGPLPVSGGASELKVIGSGEENEVELIVRAEGPEEDSQLQAVACMPFLPKLSTLVFSSMGPPGPLEVADDVRREAEDKGEELHVQFSNCRPFLKKL